MYQKTLKFCVAFDPAILLLRNYLKKTVMDVHQIQ